VGIWEDEEEEEEEEEDVENALVFVPAVLYSDAGGILMDDDGPCLLTSMDRPVTPRIIITFPVANLIVIVVTSNANKTLNVETVHI
jgi:hypothetical protein